MSRKSIFDILAERYDIEKDIERMDLLFTDINVITVSSGRSRSHYTLGGFITAYCFDDWIGRGHCLDIDDFLENVEYSKNYTNSSNDNMDACLSVIETIYNFWTMAGIYAAQNEDIILTKEYFHLGKIMSDCLSQLNHKTVYIAEKEQLLVIEDRPEITAVAEIVEPPLALEIIRYNHHSMRGNISHKRAVLRTLGAELEPKSKTLASINNTFKESIFFMLNNLNIRHNNCDAADTKRYSHFVEKMDNTELEYWYDELYQMILLAFLELEQLARIPKIKQLKGSVTGKAD